MLTLLSVVTSLAVAAAAGERPALVVEGTQPPAHITRAVVLTPGEGPPVVLYAAVSLTDQRLEQFTVMAFVFRADRSLKARQVAPGRHILEPRETKYSTLVVDGVLLDPTDVVVIGINQAQNEGSENWWRAELQPAAEAAVAGKKD
jgi:hypothetical protein